MKIHRRKKTTWIVSSVAVSFMLAVFSWIPSGTDCRSLTDSELNTLSGGTNCNFCFSVTFESETSMNCMTYTKTVTADCYSGPGSCGRFEDLTIIGKWCYLRFIAQSPSVTRMGCCLYSYWDDNCNNGALVTTYIGRWRCN
jgi:hypothetical protein